MAVLVEEGVRLQVSVGVDGPRALPEATGATCLGSGMPAMLDGRKARAVKGGRAPGIEGRGNA